MHFSFFFPSHCLFHHWFNDSSDSINFRSQFSLIFIVWFLFFRCGIHSCPLLFYHFFVFITFQNLAQSYSLPPSSFSKTTGITWIHLSSFFFLWFLLLEDQTFCLSLMAIKVFERMKVVVDDHDAFTQQKIEMKSTKMLLSWLLSFTMQTSIYFVWFIDKLSKSWFYFSLNCPVVTKSRKDVCFNRFWPKNCFTFTCHVSLACCKIRLLKGGIREKVSCL